jgi:hypothetical protein
MSPRAPRRPTKLGDHGINGGSECGVIGWCMQDQLLEGYMAWTWSFCEPTRDHFVAWSMTFAPGVFLRLFKTGCSSSPARRLAFSGRTRGMLLSELPVPTHQWKNSWNIITGFLAISRDFLIHYSDLGSLPLIICETQHVDGSLTQYLSLH